MKRQICFSLWLVVLYCAIAFAQQVPNKARREVTDGNRIDSASKHEQLIRSTYKKLIEYNHAVQGTADKRVWSETGCLCFLMTSTRDPLG